MKIYLSGTITHAPDEAFQWYDELAGILGWRGHEVYVPYKDTPENNVFKIDMAEIHSADHIIAHPQWPSIGTGIELAFASCPVTLLVVERFASSKISPFVIDFAKLRGWPLQFVAHAKEVRL